VRFAVAYEMVAVTLTACSASWQAGIVPGDGIAIH
jgi:hypothetical protein